MARRLHAVVRGADTAARLRGAEFIVVLDGMDSPGDATFVAGRLPEDVQPPVRFGDLDLTPRVSIGVAPWQEQDIDANLHDADQAMYAAKVAGGVHRRGRRHHCDGSYPRPRPVRPGALVAAAARAGLAPVGRVGTTTR